MKKGLFIVLLFNILFALGQKKIVTEPNISSLQYALIEASRQKMIGDIKEAIILYENCIKADKKCDVAYYELGAIYSALKDSKKSEENLKKAFEIDPENYWYGVAYSDMLRVNKKNKESLEILNKLKKHNQKNRLTINFKIAEIYFDTKKYTKALKILEAIQRAYGLSEMVSFMKIEAYKGMKNYKLAEDEIKILIKNNPDYSGYQIVLAEFYAEIKDTVKAVKAYEEAYRIDTADIYAITNLADIYSRKGQNELAFYYLKKAFENDNIELMNKIQALITMNKDTVSLKKNKEFIEELVIMLLKKYPENLNVKTVAYDFYNGIDNHVYALALVKQILGEKTDLYIMWQQALYNADMLKNYDEMINIGEKAIKIFPNKAELYLSVGWAYFQKQGFDSSYIKLKEGYQFIKELENNKIRYLFLIAESSYRTKRKEEAFKYYDELLKEDPGNIIIKNNYSYFLALEGQQLEKAKKLSHETILKEPQNSTYLDTYAWILFAMENYYEAMKYIEKAVKNCDGKDPDILFHYAEILNKVGKYSDSKIFYIKAGENGYDKEVIKQKLLELSKNE